MAAPVFEFVPIINEDGKASVRSVTFAGVSTLHGATENRTDGGRLYGRVTKSGSTYTVDVFNDFTQPDESQVATASGAAGAVLSFASVNGSGITGRVVVDDGTAPAQIVFVVTFSTDVDVEPDATQTAHFPGYDPTYGLAYFHAAAMRSILTSQLPAVVPQLYDDKPISIFVPASASSPAMPDLLKIENPAALREASAALAKSMSASRAEHTEEWAMIARLSRARFSAEMDAIKSANSRRPTPATDNNANVGVVVQFGEFVRK